MIGGYATMAMIMVARMEVQVQDILLHWALTGQPGESMIKTKHNFRTPEPWRRHTALRAGHEQPKTGHRQRLSTHRKAGGGPGGAGVGMNGYIDPTCE